MKNFESLEKGKILKESLIIIDKLADYNIDDNIEEIENLIVKAKILKKNRLFKLK